jgi:alcohol dehydrogenase, propanol-preferring
MKAARLESGELVIRDEPTPELEVDHALVRISAAGVCHSDLHMRRGDWAGMRGFVNLGHEGIGVVEALGPGADRFVSVGDRVILGLGGTGGGYWCGACEYCLSGHPRHCSQAKGVMGVFAEQFSAYAPGLVRIPDSISDQEAPLACGGLTAYGAVKKLMDHRVRPGRWVAVIGAAGGLGHYAVQLAQAFGYRVVGVDVGEERLEFVRSLGAEMAVSADDAIDVITNELGGVDASLVFAAKMAGYNVAFKVLRRRGLLVAVGLPATSEGKLEFNPLELFTRDATIIFSAVGTVQDMRELIDLAVAGKVKSHVSRTGSLSELDEIFEDLGSAKYLGRAVITDLRS